MQHIFKNKQFKSTTYIITNTHEQQQKCQMIKQLTFHKMEITLGTNNRINDKIQPKQKGTIILLFQLK